MNSIPLKTYRVTNDYEVAYPNPIKLAVGDTVKITKCETNPDWLGRVFCLDKTGVGGWISEKYLQISDYEAQVLRSYDATELSVSKDEIVSSLQEEFGWAWVRNRHGKEGWVPLKDLTSDGGNDRSTLETAQMILEPITVLHAQELVDLLSDPKLHEFVPFEPPTLDEQTKRCARWEVGQSPDGSEVWLNWAARHKESGEIIGHFQSGVKQDHTASVGYVVARSYQGQGLALEAMEAVLDCLRDKYAVKTAKAWSDTRNKASHKLADRLGMQVIETIKDADFFKGSSSDEFVFAKELL